MTQTISVNLFSLDGKQILHETYPIVIGQNLIPITIPERLANGSYWIEISDQIPSENN